MVGVAVLGSLLNGTLTVDLTRRLSELGVPAGFRTIVINAIETGQVPKGSGGAASAEKAFGPIVAHVIDAAYGAFRSGLSISLVVAGVVILASGLIAWVTLRGRGPSSSESPSRAVGPDVRHRRPAVRAAAAARGDRAGGGDVAGRPTTLSGRLQQRFGLERPRRRLVVLEHEVDVEPGGQQPARARGDGRELIV